MTPTQRSAALRLAEAKLAACMASRDALRDWAQECRDQVLYLLAQRDDELGRTADGLGQASVGLLRELLAEPVQEPVCWGWRMPDGRITMIFSERKENPDVEVVALYAAPQQRQPDKAAQDDAYYCGRRDEEQAWASRFANLSEMLKQSDERYMALLKNVADGMALRPPAPIIMQAPQQRQPLTDEEIDAIPFIVDFKAATLRDLAVELRRFARAIEKAITGETP